MTSQIDNNLYFRFSMRFSLKTLALLCLSSTLATESTALSKTLRGERKKIKDGRQLKYGGRKKARQRISEKLVELDSMLDFARSSKGKKSKAYTMNYDDILSAHINPYPGYTGSLTPSGVVSVRFNDDGSMHIKMNALGLEDNCANCGVHIDVRTSCDIDPDIETGHYYDQTQLENPWLAEEGLALYNSTSEGYADSAFAIDSGYNLEENNGHALVIKSQDGTHIGCGILSPYYEKPVAKLHAYIDTYPQYTGDLPVNGIVEVEFFDDDSFYFSFVGEGLEANCVDCGVHIHTGTTCDNATLVGGHYWDDEILNDPWVPDQGAFYHTDALGNADRSFYLYSGYDPEENLGHAVVIHAQDGSDRIGCGILQIAGDSGKSGKKGSDGSKSGKKGKKSGKKGGDGGGVIYPTALKATVGVYPEYEGDVPSGDIVVRFNDDGTLLFKYDGADLEEECENCGVHIHVGTSCDNATTVFGHYWNKNTDPVLPDPWTTDGGAVYNTTSDGTTCSAFTLNSGFNMTENDGHAVVVHRQDGSRSGCGVLAAVEEYPTELLRAYIGMYPDYEGPLEVGGVADVGFYSDDTFHFTFAGVGLEENCEMCGVHIHEGTTCEEAALVGGHYWNEDVIVPDPWVPEDSAYYSSDDFGATDRSFHLFSGYGYEDNVHHAVVVHGRDGTRIGCGILYREGKVEKSGKKKTGEDSQDSDPSVNMRSGKRRKGEYSQNIDASDEMRKRNWGR